MKDRENYEENFTSDEDRKKVFEDADWMNSWVQDFRLVESKKPHTVSSLVGGDASLFFECFLHEGLGLSNRSLWERDGEPIALVAYKYVWDELYSERMSPLCLKFDLRYEIHPVMVSDEHVLRVVLFSPGNSLDDLVEEG